MTYSYPIADVHCDLLCYLERNSKRTTYDAAARCSVPQLKAGHVRIQTLAVFTETGANSVQRGMAQVGIYKNLPFYYSKDFVFFNKHSPLCQDQQDRIAILLAFEGASTFSYENELLDQGLKRLQFTIDNIARPLYISLTWNMENRFGGGASTNIGLKEDGKRLLHFLHDKKIAVDFSHTSDRLAFELLDYIDRYQLEIPVMASHSNARSITSVPRNLPDEIAKEILRKKGIIGINFYRKFVGPQAEEYFIKHLSYWLNMGASSQICFGADFFYQEDLSTTYRNEQKEDDMFFPNYSNASCYQRLLALFAKQLNLNANVLEGLSHRNFLSFLDRVAGDKKSI